VFELRQNIACLALKRTLNVQDAKNRRLNVWHIKRKFHPYYAADAEVNSRIKFMTSLLRHHGRPIINSELTGCLATTVISAFVIRS